MTRQSLAIPVISGDSRGQGLTEYIVIVVLVALAVILGIRLFATSVKDQVGEVRSGIDSMSEGQSSASRSDEHQTTDHEHPNATANTMTVSSETSAAPSDVPETSSLEGEVSAGSSPDKFSKEVSRLQHGVGDQTETPKSIDEIKFDVYSLSLGAVFIVLSGLVLLFYFGKRNKMKPKKFLFSFLRLKKKKPLRSDQSGQVLVIGAFIILALTMIAISVANVGMMVSEKIHLQDTVDASAYSAAVVEARFMNLSAYINRAMVANYDMMAFDTALWSTVASHDHGSALAAATLYEVSVLVEAMTLGIATSVAKNIDSVADGIRNFLHSPMHALNRQLDNWFAQDAGKRDLNKYIEMFNTNILSMYAGLLYAAEQSARHEVIRHVAEKMDPEVSTTTVLGLGAETVSYDELAQAVDWIIDSPDHLSQPFKTLSKTFNDLAGTDPESDDAPYFLGAVTEASLDEFATGRRRNGVSNKLRTFNIGDLAGGVTHGLEQAAHWACKIATLGLKKCRYDIRIDLGAVVRDRQEDKASQWHVPIIATQRMREVNGWITALNIDGFGSKLVNWLLGQHGYTSGDRRNDVANSANVTASIEYGFPDRKRFVESFLAGSFTMNPADVPKRGLNMLNMLMARQMGVTLPVFCDDHWDGSYKSKPVNFAEIFPPGPGQVEAVKYLGEVIAAGKTEPGVPNYDWKVNLDDVGFFNYFYPSTGAEKRPRGSSGGGGNNALLTGPSVAVVGVKPWNKVNGLYGLGLGNDYDLTAISRAQVYYLRNPNRPNEIPSLFNPHWVARLAPVDSEDTPELLRHGLSYIGSMGIPVAPTH